MKIEDMTLVEILEYIRDNFDNDINLYMRCLEEDEYYPLSEMNLETEVCKSCEEE